jgi:hypothetical protein
MTVSDIFLKSRVEQAITLQAKGHFIIDHRRELPLPTHPTLEELRYSRERDDMGRYFDYENSWGKFSYDSETRSVLVLRKGTPPDELVPQPKLSIATATVHTGFVKIHNNGSSFELDMQTRDQLDYGTLKLINQTLATEGLPVVVWQADQEKRTTPPVIRITNDSALVFSSSAIWDQDNQQLVAAHVVTTSQELLKAIKASLANNGSKEYLTVKTPDDSAFLKGARRGFTVVSSSLAQANADGTVTAMLHPLAGDPQANAADYFYLVVAPNEDLNQKFAERLDLAIPWPIQPEWAEKLLEAGQEEGLVEVLPSAGSDFHAGLRISKNESLWHKLISVRLKSGGLQIANS